MIHGWDGIEEFVAVATAGSFTAGGRSFGASVTHMSRSVARLEERIETQLFLRTTRTLNLTETGRIFLERCKRLVEEREDAIAALDVHGEPRGSMRLTCSYALGEKFIGPLVREYAQRYPALDITINFDNQIMDIVSQGYDLAVRTGHLEDSRLIATRVAHRELVTVASREYISQHGKPGSIADLNNHRCLVGSSLHWQFRNGQQFQPKGLWQCNSGISILDACIAGMGVCQIPAFYIGDNFAAGRLQPVLVDESPENEPIWAIYPTRRHLSPKVSKLVALLRDRLQDMLTVATA